MKERKRRERRGEEEGKRRGRGKEEGKKGKGKCFRYLGRYRFSSLGT